MAGTVANAALIVPMSASVVEPVGKRVAFICPGGSAVRELRPLLAALVGKGHRAFVLSPALQTADAAEFGALGIDHAPIGWEDSEWKLLSAWKAIGAVRQQLSRWGADVVVAIGGQTMIYGALAAKRAHVARTIVIVGALPEHRFSGALGEDEMPAWRYGQALRSADVALFNNGDDIALLNKLGIIPEGLPVSVMPCGGMDLEAFSLLPLPPITQGLVFLMIAGLDPRRGIADYCAAAKLLRQRAPGSRFLLAALPDDGAANVIDVEHLAASNDIEFLGACEDHAALLARAHVFVYPARSDGMPQPLLNALAVGRPIVTSAIAGCRETVEQRVNGVLVPARDVDALAEAMESFLRRPDLIPSMARASRAKAEGFASMAEVQRTLMDALALDDA